MSARAGTGAAPPDQCAGRTKGCDLPVSHAHCLAEQKPIRPVPPLGPSLSYSAHSFPPFIPGPSHSAVWAAGLFPQHPWGEANPRGGVEQGPRLSFSRKEMGRLYQAHLCGRQTVRINLWEIQASVTELHGKKRLSLSSFSGAQTCFIKTTHFTRL